MRKKVGQRIRVETSVNVRNDVGAHSHVVEISLHQNCLVFICR